MKDIKQSEIDSFRKETIIELKKLGATEDELDLLHDATIKNSIRSKRSPEDVAWAIMQ